MGLLWVSRRRFFCRLANFFFHRSKKRLSQICLQRKHTSSQKSTQPRVLKSPRNLLRLSLLFPRSQMFQLALTLSQKMDKFDSITLSSQGLAAMN